MSDDDSEPAGPGRQLPCPECHASGPATGQVRTVKAVILDDDEVAVIAAWHTNQCSQRADHELLQDVRAGWGAADDESVTEFLAQEHRPPDD